MNGLKLKLNLGTKIPWGIKRCPGGPGVCVMRAIVPEGTMQGGRVGEWWVGWLWLKERSAAPA